MLFINWSPEKKDFSQYWSKWLQTGVSKFQNNIFGADIKYMKRNINSWNDSFFHMVFNTIKNQQLKNTSIADIKKK